MRNNKGLEFIILKEFGTPIKWLVRFIETGSTRVALKANASKGKITDLYHRSRYNVGYHGDVKKVYYQKQATQLWANMLKRCYTDDPKGYKKWGTLVSPRWHCLANFIEDIFFLDRFDEWVVNTTKMNLDKDTKCPGCNIYSPDTCVFIGENLNKSLGAQKTVKDYYRTLSKK
jgi:hypothetical protein